MGGAIASALAKAGTLVAVNYRDDRDGARNVVEAIGMDGGSACAFCADASRGGSVQDLIAAITQRLGPVEILVNNAGIAITRGLDDLTEEDFDRTIAVNLKSAFLCTQAVLPGMRARQWGRIINISSIGARIGAGSVSVAYAASKAGLEGLTRAYALRLAPEGITVNSVAPGLVDTDMGQPLIDAGVAARIPMGRCGTKDEIAQAVMFLVGNAYATGQTLAVNGGSLFL